MARTTLASILVSLLTLPLTARSAEAPKKGAPPPFTVDLRAAAMVGAFDGWGVREESGAMSIVELSAKAERKRGGFTLEVPVRLAHRQTFGADLSETSGSIGVEPWWQLSPAVRAGPVAEILGAYRPGWPDLYQRDGDPTSPTYGTIPPTDRYSYLAGRAGVQTYVRPAPRQHLRARYRLAVYDYADDPLFREQLAPYHLTPRDRVQHELDVSWRLVRRTWAFALRGDYTFRAYSELLSRPSAGSPPRQRLHLFEPSVELEVRPLGGRLDLSLRYGHDLQRDPYQGYYTYGGHHPRVQARFTASDRLAIGASYEGWYHEYTADGSGRVDDAGPRRSDRTRIGAEAEYRLRGGLSLRAEADWVRRTTNYSDYVPPPAGTSQYDIDFDYVNLSAVAGIAWRR